MVIEEPRLELIGSIYPAPALVGPITVGWPRRVRSVLAKQVERSLVGLPVGDLDRAEAGRIRFLPPGNGALLEKGDQSLKAGGAILTLGARDPPVGPLRPGEEGTKEGYDHDAEHKTEGNPLRPRELPVKVAPCRFLQQVL